MPVTVRLEPEIYERLKRLHRGGSTSAATANWNALPLRLFD